MTNSIQTLQPDTAEALDKVLLNQDLSPLTPTAKLHYILKLCKSLGLNPLTKPIQLIRFQGKEVVYFTRDATDQLRKLHKVSIAELTSKMLEGGIYVVYAKARTADNREDTSTAALVTQGMRGDSLANALMKCETKAKRRVTLSICGLGGLDETELDTLPVEAAPAPLLYPFTQELCANAEKSVEDAANLTELEAAYKGLKAIDFVGNEDRYKYLVTAIKLKKTMFEQPQKPGEPTNAN